MKDIPISEMPIERMRAELLSALNANNLLNSKITQLTSHIKLHAGDCESLRTEVDMFRERCIDLEESLAASGALLADTEAKLEQAMIEANDLRVRVEGLLLEIEGR